MSVRIGQGIDFHRLEKGLELWLGGINIPSEKGCVAHSDGDVLLHAICDAMLGAAGLNDIGFHFPDTEPEYKNVDSKLLLKRCCEMIGDKGYSVINIDSTVCLEKPKIASFNMNMRRTVAEIIGTDPENVSIKATTTEKLGFTGREEGIVAMASVLLSDKKEND